MSPVEHELLTHAAALRRLARDLVGSDDADDLVQETALRALRSQAVLAGGLGGFLATILRRLAGTHRREQGRRMRREQAAARPEVVPAADHQVAHGEMLQRLTAAVMALPQPYRDALLQRYFEGRRPAAIARRLDLPIATVKTRLQRGLQRLREQLDAGERSDWREALVGAFGLEQLTGLTGVLLMGTGTKLVIGGAAAMLAAVAFFAWPAEPGTATSAVTAGGNAEPAVAAAATARPAPTPESPVRRDELPPAIGPRDVGVTIRGRCVDAVTRAALPGCRLSVRADARGRDLPPPAAPIVTSADGCLQFTFAPLAEATITVEVRAEGRLKRIAYLGELPKERVVELGDIDLTPGARVSGKVVGPAGEAVADCNLVIADLPVAVRAGNGEKIFARSKGDGTFAFEDVVPPGTWPLEQGRDGWIQVAPRSVTVGAGAAAVEVTVVTAPTPSISGCVVDPSGKPIAKATVRPVLGLGNRYPSAESKADGSFELFAIATDPHPERLEVSARGYELPAPTAAIPWGTRDVRFVLESGVSVEVEVVERAGQHVVEQFAVTAPKEHGPFPSRQWTAVSFPQGRVTLDGLERGRHIVAVMPKDPMLLPNQILVDVVQGMRTVRIELERMQTQPVIVRDAQGRPVAGAVVEVLHLGRLPLTQGRLHDWRRLWPQVSERTIGEDPWPALYGKAETDAQGEATLGIPDNDRELGVRATSRGHVPMILSHPSPIRGQPWILTLETAAALHGHLRVAGYPPGRAFLALTADDAADEVIKVELAADGSFRIDDLQPGPRVLCLGMDVSGNAWPFDPPLRRVTLGAGENAELDLDASRFDAGTVKGRVVVDGQPLVDARVRLAMQLLRKGRSAGMNTGDLPVDGVGRFTAAAVFPGKWRLRLLVEDHGRQVALTHGDEITVAGGIVEREFHFVRHRLNVRVRDPQGAPLAGRTVWAGLPTTDTRAAETDADGMVVFDWMPDGNIMLSQKPADPFGRTAEGKVVAIPATGLETAFELQWK